VAAGTFLADVVFSHWMLFMVFLLALFLGFTKRRQEFLYAEGIEGRRFVLRKYSLAFIDQMIPVLTASIVVVYMLYTVDARTVAQFGGTHLAYTIPFVYYGVFRYLYLVHKRRETEDPTAVLLRDGMMQLNLVMWMAVSVAVIYFHFYRRISMRVLITGAPGWLGNRFLDVLASGYDGEGAPNNWRLRCLVVPGIDVSYLKKVSERRPLELVEGDITRAETLKGACDGVDTVFHIAGIIHPRSVAELFAINARGTENMVRAASAAGVRRFVHISSNSVAGTNASRTRLMTEEDPPRPYLAYGRSKHRGEEAVNRAHREKGLETVILRPCWYYGPNQPERQTTFFRMIEKGNPVLFGDGENLRSMSYLDNTCQAMLLAAASPQAPGQTYWIADERPYTTNEIYSTVAELLGVKAFRPRRLPGFSSELFLAADRLLQLTGAYVKEIHVAGEMNKNIACSIDKACRQLGYAPRIGLREGMWRSIEWCRRAGML
jgi:nucleoside-diphosphate-sugar epimerase